MTGKQMSSTDPGTLAVDWLKQQGLSAAVAWPLQAQATVERWSRERRIHFTPEGPQALYLLLKGRALVGRRLDQGREAYQQLKEPGEWLGELLVLEPDFPPFFVQALEPTTGLRVPVATLHRLMMTQPTFNLHLVSSCAERLRQQQQQQEAMLQQNAQERIMAFLCEYCLRCGRQQPNGEVIVPYVLSHNAWAKFTATSRQSVNALLTALRRAGELDYDALRLVVAEEQLQAWCGQYRGQLPFLRRAPRG